MSDTESTNPAGEVETTTPATEVSNDQAGAQDTNASQVRDEKGRFASRETTEEEPDIDPSLLAEEGEAAQPEEDVEEVDFEGKRYSVPKTLKDGLMRNADYTRKTQELATQRKQLEETFAQQKQQAESQQADFEEYTALHTLEKYLEQFKNIDWDKAQDEDPVAASKQFIHWQTMKADLQERRGKLQQKQSERALQAQREAARRAEEGQAALRQTIKGWSPETESALRAYAKETGVPNAGDLQFAMHPQETKILHKAYLYDQLMKKAQAKPKAPEAKPVSTVGQSSRSSANDLSDNLSPEEWARRFRARQLRK